MVDVASHSASAFAAHVEVAAVHVLNVVLVISDIMARAPVDLDEKCGCIEQSCWTRNPETGKIKLKVDILEWSVSFSVRRPV